MEQVKKWSNARLFVFVIFVIIPAALFEMLKAANALMYEIDAEIAKRGGSAE